MWAVAKLEAGPSHSPKKEMQDEARVELGGLARGWPVGNLMSKNKNRNWLGAGSTHFNSTTTSTVINLTAVDRLSNAGPQTLGVGDVQGCTSRIMTVSIAAMKIHHDSARDTTNHL